MSRTVNNNTLPSGWETATATHGGWYVSPGLAYGHRFALGGGFAVTPVERLRYVAASLGGYTQTGTTANLTVGRRSLQDIKERGEARLSHTTAFAPGEALTWTLHGGVLALQRLGDTTVNTVLLGQGLPFATPGKSSVAGAFGGLGFDWRSHNVSWFAAAEYLAMSDSSNLVGGKAGIRVAF